MRDEQIYSLALTRIPGLGLISACHLVKTLGSATAVFQQRKELPSLIEGVSSKLVDALNHSEAFKRAEEELLFAERVREEALLTVYLPEYTLLPGSVPASSKMITSM